MTRSTSFVRAIANWLAVVRGVFARHERLFWAASIALVIVVQWPMLKGLYYRAAATPPSPSSIEWRTDLDAALAEARRTRKQVLVDISADWCPPCVVMKYDVWPDPAVGRAVAQSYVPVLIDADRDVTVMNRYGITGIPAILVVDDRGAVIRRATFLSASGMVEFLRDTTAEELPQ